VRGDDAVRFRLGELDPLVLEELGLKNPSTLRSRPARTDGCSSSVVHAP
jgi:hypothetical protein